MPPKVRLAFIGCGGVVAGHLDAGLKDFPDVEFVGWCDVNEGAAEARQEQAGGRGSVYADPAKMISQAQPDALFIMVPPFAHGAPEALAVEHKLPFFIEKPVASNMSVARKAAAGIKRVGLITSVGYMTRYRHSVQRVKELVDGQTPVLMHGGWIGGGPDPDSDSWWVQKDKSGGQFLEQTTHTTDLARYLFGEVTAVYAVPIRERRKHGRFFTAEDASMVQLTFANGAAANLYSSCSTPVGGGIRLLLWTTEMQAEFTGWDHAVTIRLSDGEPITVPGEEDIFAVEDRVFIDSVKAGRSEGILSTYEDGMRTAAIACAANESMAIGKPVKPEA